MIGHLPRLCPSLFLFLALLSPPSVLAAGAGDIPARYDKVIIINQPKQTGAAYERGRKLFDFPVITGDDEDTTDPGVYVVRKKEEDYHSRKYDTPMPYSLFFDLKNMKAIHGGEVPPPAVKRDYATHGCIHVEHPDIARLFSWAEEGKTVVVIQGWRTGD